MTLALRFKKALRFGMDTHDEQDIVAGIQRGEFQIFTRDDAVIITSIHASPKKKYMHVFLSAGVLESVLSMQDELDAFARSHGCEYMTASARFGFKRFLPKLGWKPKYVTFVREVPRGQE